MSSNGSASDPFHCPSDPAVPVAPAAPAVSVVPALPLGPSQPQQFIFPDDLALRHAVEHEVYNSLFYVLQYEADHEIIQAASELIYARYIEFSSTPVLGILNMFLRSRGLWPMDIPTEPINSILQTITHGNTSSNSRSTQGLSASASADGHVTFNTSGPSSGAPLSQAAYHRVTSSQQAMNDMLSPVSALDQARFSRG